MSGSIRYKDGAWRLTAQVDGRRHYATHHGPDNRTGRTQAGKALARLVTELEAGRHRGDPTTTLTDAAQAWLDHKAPTVAAKTWEGYEAIVRLRIAPHLGDHRLNRLTAHDVDQWASTLRAKAGDLRAEP